MNQKENIFFNINKNIVDKKLNVIDKNLIFLENNINSMDTMLNNFLHINNPVAGSGINAILALKKIKKPIRG